MQDTQAISSAQAIALDTSLFQVECRFMRGFSGLSLIGNHTEVCRSGIERARSSLESLGITFPQKKMILSISPAEIKKDGSQFDLPFAMSMASLLIEREPIIKVSEWVFVGELSLGGELRSVRSAISYALEAASSGYKGIVVSKDNLRELHALSELGIPGNKSFQIIAFENLKQVLSWTYDGVEDCYTGDACSSRNAEMPTHKNNFDDMLLDQETKTAIEAVAAGGHNFLMYGAPGTGKSMIAERLPSIIPLMNPRQHLKALRINSSFAPVLSSELIGGRPPIRTPHHQSSAAAVLGTPDAPGEISLSHGGLLFLDEMPEFRRDILEGLREPLEMGKVQVSRAKSKVTWDAEVCLVGTANNCPCGWLGSDKKPCSCASSKIAAYKRKLSGPILDRIDIHLNVKEIPTNDRTHIFYESANGEKSQTTKMRSRVNRARQLSLARNHQFGVTLNRYLPASALPLVSGTSETEFKKLIETPTLRQASNRALVRCLRVARTLADLDEKNAIEKSHLTQSSRWLAQNSAKLRHENLQGSH